MDDKDLFKQVNSQGYLFQLAVEQEISRIKQHIDTRWHVVSREQRWVDPIDNKEKFIDLILESTKGRLIVECKRVGSPEDAPWVFLVEPGYKRNTYRAKLLWSCTSKSGRTAFDWDDLNLMGSSPESSFCVLPGQTDKNIPMLERVAGSLLRSSEWIADAEVTAKSDQKGKLIGVYIPVIITNAELKICKFSPEDIDLDSGTLSEAKFENVPLVRFRKSLSSGKTRKSKSISEMSTAQERTVIVANVNHLLSILPILELQKTTDWPWLSTTEYD